MTEMTLSRRKMMAAAGLALAAVSRLPGTLVHELARYSDPAHATIAHPSGVVDLTVDVTPEGKVRSVGLVRTARLLLRGVACL
jgi:2-methylaconitate cis-trans-isomerase PrpF